MKYKAIAFDYSGVITESSGSDFTLKACHILDISQDEFYAVYLKHNHLCNTTEMDWKVFWKILLKEWQREDKEAEFFKYIASDKSDTKYNYELLDLIKKLKVQGYKIGLLSNNSSKLNQKLKDAGIDVLFDEILISGDVGCMKPNIKIFQMLCERLAIKPEELVFIDDFEKNFINSDKVGFTPILYLNMEDLKNKFDQIGIIR